MTQQTSVRTIIVLYSFLIMNTGVPYSYCYAGFNTLISTIRISSFHNVSLLMCGTGYYILLKGLAYGFILISTGYVFHLPSVPSKRSLESLSRRRRMNSSFAYNLCSNCSISLRLEFSFSLSRIYNSFSCLSSYSGIIHTLHALLYFVSV